VAAAVAEAGLMTDQHLAWAKTVSARAVCGCPHYPRACVDRTSSPTAAIKTTVGVRLPPGSGSLGADALRGDG
jgi:hypothetical protein